MRIQEARSPVFTPSKPLRSVVRNPLRFGLYCNPSSVFPRSHREWGRPPGCWAQCLQPTPSSAWPSTSSTYSEPPCVSMRILWWTMQTRMLTHGGSDRLCQHIFCNELSGRCTSLYGAESVSDRRVQGDPRVNDFCVETLDLSSETMIPVISTRFIRESASESADCLRKGAHDFNNRSGRS